MPTVFFVPEAQPRDTKLTVGIIPILHFNNKHILMARGIDKGILFVKIILLILQNTLKV